MQSPCLLGPYVYSISLNFDPIWLQIYRNISLIGSLLPSLLGREKSLLAVVIVGGVYSVAESIGQPLHIWIVGTPSIQQYIDSENALCGILLSRSY